MNAMAIAVLTVWTAAAGSHTIVEQRPDHLLVLMDPVCEQIELRVLDCRRVTIPHNTLMSWPQRNRAEIKTAAENAGVIVRVLKVRSRTVPCGLQSTARVGPWVDESGSAPVEYFVQGPPDGACKPFEPDASIRRFIPAAHCKARSSRAPCLLDLEELTDVPLFLGP